MLNFFFDLLHHFWLLLILVLTCLASWGVGEAVLTKLLPLPKHRQKLSIILPFFLGQVFFSSALVLSSILLSAPFNLLLISPALVFGIWRTVRALFSVSYSNQKYAFDLDVFVITTILVGILLFHFAYSFHRPSEWDEVAYHFPALEELAAGHLHFPLLQHHPYTSFYQPFSDFYGSLAFACESFAATPYLLSFHHPATAHLVYFMNFVAFLIFVSFVLREFFAVETFTNRVISLLLATNPAIVILLTTGTIDLQVMIFQFVAFALAPLSKRQKTPQLVLISAILMGFAIGQKFTSVFLLPVYFPLVYYCGWPKTRQLKWIFGGAALMAMSGGIWYFLNLLLHFNPIYPLYFGHHGMSDQSYHFLMETLINSLRTPVTFKNILLNLKNNYLNDTSTILAAILVTLSVLLRKLKPNLPNLVLTAVVIFFFSINFVVGSQLSRYILLCPIILHLFLAQAINKQKLLAVFVLVIALISIRLNPSQWVIWKSRLTDLPNAFQTHFSSSDATRLGCVARAFSFIQQHQPPSQALNLWDAYAGSYYASSHLFYHLPQNFSAEKLELPTTVKLLYLNSQIKTEILAAPIAHFDMRPAERASLEAQLINHSLPIFEDGNCALYQLQ